MKKKLLIFTAAIMVFRSFPVFASGPEDNPGTETVEVKHLTEEEYQYVDALPSVNMETTENLLPESTETYIDLGIFKLTAYCECEQCNYPYFGQPTSFGTDYVEGRTIAVDKRIIPLGSIVEINIPGEGWHRYRAEDQGGAIKGNKIDIFVNGHENCNQARYNSDCPVRLVK